MYQKAWCTCRTVVLLIKPIVFWRSRCRRSCLSSLRPYRLWYLCCGVVQWDWSRWNSCVTKPAIIHSAFPLMQTFKVLFSFHQTNLAFGELFMSVEKSKFSTTLLYHTLADYEVTSTITTEWSNSRISLLRQALLGMVQGVQPRKRFLLYW